MWDLSNPLLSRTIWRNVRSSINIVRFCLDGLDPNRNILLPLGDTNSSFPPPSWTLLSLIPFARLLLPLSFPNTSMKLAKLLHFLPLWLFIGTGRRKGRTLNTIQGKRKVTVERYRGEKKKASFYQMNSSRISLISREIFGLKIILQIVSNEVVSRCWLHFQSENLRRFQFWFAF